MLRIFWLFISLFLILIIFLNMPKELTGLSGFMDKSKFFNSPSSSGQFLNNMIGFFTIIYIVIAFYLD